MSFDPDEMIPYKGNMITKNVLWHKVKGLGWTTAAFGQLTDEEVITVLEQRKTPAQMGKSLVQTFTPKEGPPNLDSAEGDDPSIMGPAGTQPREEPPAPATGAVMESGVAAVAVAPPAHAGKHLRPIDPTRPQAAGQPAPAPIPAPGPMRGATGTFPPPNVKPPKTDTAKLMSMLDAAFQLAQNDTTVPTAKVLIATNSLERAFQALYPDLARKVLGRFDTSPDPKCRGGVILDMELETADGYCHIITNAGTITITGNNLIHKGA